MLIHNIPTGKTPLLRAAGKTPSNSGEQLDANTEVPITDGSSTPKPVVGIPTDLVGTFSGGHTKLA